MKNRLAQWPRHLIRAGMILGVFLFLHWWTNQQTAPPTAGVPVEQQVADHDPSPRRDGLAIAIVWDTHPPAHLSAESFHQWQDDAHASLRDSLSILTTFASRRSHLPLRLGLYTPSSPPSPADTHTLLPMDAPQPVLLDHAMSQITPGQGQAGLSSALITAQRELLATRLTDCLLVVLTPRQDGIDPAAAQVVWAITAQDGPHVTRVTILTMQADAVTLKEKLAGLWLDALTRLDPTFSPADAPAADPAAGQSASPK